MVDVADGYYRGEMAAGDVLKKINRDVIGREEGNGYLKPIRVVSYFCYNLSGHINRQRVIADRPGLCPKCGQELEPGNGTIPL